MEESCVRSTHFLRASCIIGRRSGALLTNANEKKSIVNGSADIDRISGWKFEEIRKRNVRGDWKCHVRM
jgi:hypothetical protein